MNKQLCLSSLGFMFTVHIGLKLFKQLCTLPFESWLLILARRRYGALDGRSLSRPRLTGSLSFHKSYKITFGIAFVPIWFVLACFPWFGATSYVNTGTGITLTV